MKDGGPAFPAVTFPKDASGALCGVYPQDEGMTLRDWFAGQALAGWVANTEVGGAVETAAKYCYKLADAMLSAKEGEDAK